MERSPPTALCDLDKRTQGWLCQLTLTTCASFVVRQSASSHFVRELVVPVVACLRTSGPRLKTGSEKVGSDLLSTLVP